MRQGEDHPAQPPTHVVPATVRPSGLADRISEDIMQLLYVARQEIAEIAGDAPGDPQVTLASRCILDALAGLRDISTLLRDHPSLRTLDATDDA